jgi:hypothetical protein
MNGCIDIGAVVMGAQYCPYVKLTCVAPPEAQQ